MEKSGGSRLLQMQVQSERKRYESKYNAKFQQKQLEERELKIASLYEAQQARALDRVRHSPSNGSVGKTTTPPASVNAAPTHQPTVPVQPGKVRQMFEERRTKAGIDKSYPLQPINNNNNKQAPTRKPQTNGYTKPPTVTNGHKPGYTAKVKGPITAQNGVKHSKSLKLSETSVKEKSVKHSSSMSMKKSESVTVTNGYKHSSPNKINEKAVKNTISHHVHNNKLVDIKNGGDLNHNHVTDLNANSHQRKSKSYHGIIKEENRPPSRRGDREEDTDPEDHNNYRLEDETFPEAMAPAPTPRSREPSVEPKRPQRRKSGTSGQPEITQSSPKPSPRRTRNISDSSKPPVQMNRSSQLLTKRPSEKAKIGSRTSSNSGGANLKCTTSTPPPATADVPGVACAVCGRKFAPDRIQRHEDVCKKAHAKKRKPFDALKHRLAGTEAEQFIGRIRRTKTALAKSSSTGGARVSHDWRQKHNEFIQAIRAAKQVQAHLDAGGKLSDLPPPPPSVNPDYVGCPHCGRRFNQAAADRHIPKCANFLFNKPKPNPKKRS